ncbi:hypothetical protein NM688_g5728 [Phlebia brevispora]|uniref:Uncharacterized protein n=1 Tax=Phlebia brevispora TaxID=194682 RepID=A0ACC1SR31_9APHY|nr:hypothetical protein NM688_g5728 [Phlebia brevispora]
MFSKFAVVIPFILGLVLQVSAHAIISPALGVTGTPVRNDVQRPTTQAPCGNVNIAQAIGTTTPINAAADGTFTTNVTNFNGGQDGSRQVTAKVDASATGTGTSFVPATVTKNGDLAPTDVGSQEIDVQLPAGTQCTGGTNKNLCLVSFTTAGNFGNCVLVQQGDTTTGAAGISSVAASPAITASATANGTTTTAGKKHHHHHKKPEASAAPTVAARAWGSRMARIFVEEVDEMM